MNLHPRDRIGIAATGAATFLGLALMVSGSSVAPADGPALSARTRALELSSTTQQLLIATLEHELGQHAEPRIPQSWQALYTDDFDRTLPEQAQLAEELDQLSLAVRLAAGRRSYAENCQHCHGVRGEAETQTAKILLPRPRDFSLGFTKFKSTPGNSAPLRADLHRVLEQGVASTAMASFAQLDALERVQLTDYVQYLLMRGALETRVGSALAALPSDETAAATEIEFRILQASQVASIAVAADWRNASSLVLQTAPEPESAEAIARGQVLYSSARAACSLCHGADGKGRGLGAWDSELGWLLRDVWGNPIRPADFSYGSFHAGASPKEIYRSIALGVAGTPMAGYQNTLEPNEISDLTHYLRSLSR
jgi:mono/diheme cytochrome c family protein